MVASSSESAVRDPVRDLLEGLEAGDDLETVYRSVGSSFGFGSKTSPRGLLDLAASAFAACGASSASPLVLDELESRYLAEWPARGNAAHQKRRYAIQAAIRLLRVSSRRTRRGGGWTTYGFTRSMRSSSSFGLLPIDSGSPSLRSAEGSGPHKGLSAAGPESRYQHLPTRSTSGHSAPWWN